MIRRFFARTDAIGYSVLVWKCLLFALFVLPIPFNDSFFYDGPVVNAILNGTYSNPTLAQALPIAGTKVFSAYPPLYQGVLFVWMSWFGTSASAAMALHLVLFVIYAFIFLGTCRQLTKSFHEDDATAWSGTAVRLASLFLLGISFHDRPDSLAHIFGTLALYAWLRARTSETVPNRQEVGWGCLMSLSLILSLATGLQIGAFYMLVGWLAVYTDAVLSRTLRRALWLPLAVSVLVSAALIILVKTAFPLLWAGFMEHAQQTPSLTGWRLPAVSEFLKAARTLPGLLVAGVCVPMVLRQLSSRAQHVHHPAVPLLLAGAVAGATVTGAALFVLTANSVMFASYLQPIVVAALLLLIPRLFPRLPAHALTALVLCCALLASVRTVGLSTWGVACALKSSYNASIKTIRKTLDETPPGSTVVLSAAYLYEAVLHKQLRSVHSDWLMPARRREPVRDLEGLLALKPHAVILTQFDYYRRYQPVLEELRTHPELREMALTNYTRVPVPDALPSMQKVLQHVSWAPVIVKLQWR